MLGGKVSLNPPKIDEFPSGVPKKQQLPRTSHRKNPPQRLFCFPSEIDGSPHSPGHPPSQRDELPGRLCGGRGAGSISRNAPGNMVVVGKHFAYCGFSGWNPTTELLKSDFKGKEREERTPGGRFRGFKLSLPFVEDSFSVTKQHMWVLKESITTGNIYFFAGGLRLGTDSQKDDRQNGLLFRAKDLTYRFNGKSFCADFRASHCLCFELWN